MNLSELTAEPSLIKVVINDKDTLKKYKEPLEFYTWDRQPVAMFMQLASIGEGDGGKIVDIVKTLILDENGNQIITDKSILPTDIMMKAVTKVTEMLGK